MRGCRTPQSQGGGSLLLGSTHQESRHTGRAPRHIGTAPTAAMQPDSRHTDKHTPRASGHEQKHAMNMLPTHALGRRLPARRPCGDACVLVAGRGRSPPALPRSGGPPPYPTPSGGAGREGRVGGAAGSIHAWHATNQAQHPQPQVGTLQPQQLLRGSHHHKSCQISYTAGEITRNDGNA